MTAVAPPPSFQTLNRQAWGQPNTSSNGLPSMSPDDVSRMLMPPRKTATRSNSSSSLSSVSSNASTLTTASTGSTGSNPSVNGEAASRKRPSRYLWPMSKAEPTAGITTARTQSMTSTSGQPAASAISALQNGQMNSANGTASQNGGRGQAADNTPILYLTPLNGTFERKTISVPTYPDVIKIGRQTNAKTIPTPYNGFFDSKVLSRSHAEIWADRNGQIWIRDVKSSNGTFINGQRLSQENKDSDPKEVSDGDSLELGIDIVSEDQKTVVHHKVAARVEHAGFVSSSTLLDLNLPMNDLDPSNQHNQLNNQAMGHMRRKSGQGDMMPLRGQMGMPGMISNNAPAQRSHIWLQPPNMEMAIKRLTAEYKMAQQQAHELQRSTQFLDSVINAVRPPQQEPLPSSDSQRDPKRSSNPSIDGPLKSRFADPPNPPPQAPLPEKPSDINLGGFRRSDTEKPRIPNEISSGLKEASTATQIATLSDALAAAKKEFEHQNKRLREMENLLVEERVKRENAEARAQRLETRGITVRTDAQVSKDNENENDPSTPIEDEANSEIGQKPAAKVVSQSATEKLQKRLDLLLIEFQEVKQSAEKWRREKDDAVKERDEERIEKVSLMEMVETLRKEQKERQLKKERKEKKKSAKKDIPQSDSVVEDDNSSSDEDEMNGDPPTMDLETLKLKPFSMSNGHSASSLLQTHGRGGASGAKGPASQFDHAAPYLSAMSVVLVGVAIMAMINKMSSGEK